MNKNNSVIHNDEKENLQTENWRSFGVAKSYSQFKIGFILFVL